MSQSAREEMDVDILYDVQNKNVLIYVWRFVNCWFGEHLSGRVFQALGAAILTAHSPNLSLARGKNKSMFDADLRTVGWV